MTGLLQPSSDLAEFRLGMLSASSNIKPVGSVESMDRERSITKGPLWYLLKEWMMVRHRRQTKGIREAQEWTKEEQERAFCDEEDEQRECWRASEKLAVSSRKTMH